MDLFERPGREGGIRLSGMQDLVDREGRGTPPSLFFFPSKNPLPPPRVAALVSRRVRAHFTQGGCNGRDQGVGILRHGHDLRGLRARSETSLGKACRREGCHGGSDQEGSAGHGRGSRRLSGSDRHGNPGGRKVSGEAGRVTSKRSGTKRRCAIRRPHNARPPGLPRRRRARGRARPRYGGRGSVAADPG